MNRTDGSTIVTLQIIISQQAYYSNGIDRIIIAKMESEVTEAVREAAVNAVAKGVDLTDRECAGMGKRNNQRTLG